MQILDEAAPGMRMDGFCASLPSLRSVVWVGGEEAEHVPGIHLEETAIAPNGPREALEALEERRASGMQPVSNVSCCSASLPKL
jgi:hypothetical protein